MAHFAELDIDNTVIRVIVIDNDNILNAAGKEVEDKGIDYCKELFGEDTKWKQCSFSSSFRKNFPSSIFSYDEDRDAFLPPRPFDSYTLNEVTCQWEAPEPYPEDGNYYVWDEENLTWKYMGVNI